MTFPDTIYALSSGAGMAGIAVIRASGPSAGLLIDDVAGKRPAPRVVGLRLLRDPASGEAIDKGLVLWMPGPQSATAEDVAEFHVHGSQAVIEGLFAVFSRYRDVRPAEAGEFTRRAFANSQMDLVEIEGLADLLRARTASQRRLAVHHLLGDASSIYDQWRDALIGILAHVEAAVDFSEEQGIAEIALITVKSNTTALGHSMAVALQAADRARAIRDGVKVVLAGLPNTGKSSLLNAIAKRDAAIVSSRPGTTRDVIEVMIDLEGMPVLLTDTAGLRDGEHDEIENIGIAKARLQISEADITIWVSSPDIPASGTVTPGVAPDLWCIAKADLVPEQLGHSRNDTYRVSSLTGKGLPSMLAGLKELVDRRYGSAEHAVIVRTRQKQAIEESIRHLNDSMRHGPGQLELVAEDLRKGAFSLARVTGRIGVEDLLSSIFAEFCIGK